MKKILVIGSINVDMVVKVDHIPVTGETILADSTIEVAAGGKGANQACAVGKLGGNVCLLGGVGNDENAHIQRKSLSTAGVDISRLIVKDKPTGVAWIPVNKHGDNCIFVLPSANNVMSIQDIIDNEDLIRDCDILVMQMEIPFDTVIYAAKCAKKHGKMVILDPAPVPKDFPEELFSYVDIIKPNENEFAQMLAEEVTDYKIATEKMLNKGVSVVIVTLGGEGLFVNSKETGFRKLDAIKTTVIDTTAAGDTFTAGLSMKLLDDAPLLEAIHYAMVASSITVSRHGAQCSIPTKEEVIKKMEMLR